MKGLIWFVGLLVIVAALADSFPATAGKMWALSVVALLWVCVGLVLAASAAFHAVNAQTKKREARAAIDRIQDDEELPANGKRTRFGA